MTWRDAIEEYAQQRGCEVFESILGIGIEYSDGCDAYWILPNEPMSSIAVPDSGPPDIDAILHEFERISDLRQKTLHIVRHHFAAQGAEIISDRDGQWMFASPSGTEGSIEAGTSLTTAAMQSKNVDETIERWQGVWWLGKRPSKKQISRYLALPAPESVIVEETNDDCGISDVLAMMGVCRALGDPSSLADPEKAIELAKPKGRIGRAMKRFAERLPNANAALELLSPGTICVDFDDELDTFDIRVRDRDFAKRFRGREAESVGDELADEYSKLNAARNVTLGAIAVAAANRGWSHQFFGFAMMGVGENLFLGDGTREVELDVGKSLTELLRSVEPSEALSQILNDHPSFLKSCLDAWDNSKSMKLSDLPESELRPREVDHSVALLEIDEVVTQQMDAFAVETIEMLFQDRETLWEYSNPDFYNPKSDSWASESRWRALANLRVDSEYIDASVVVILLDFGDASGDSAARRLLSQINEHHDEQDDAAIEIIWRYRKEYPDVALMWLGPDSGTEHDDVRARLGDPVASRRLHVANGDKEERDLQWVRRLDTNTQNQHRQQLLNWASRTHRFSPIDIDPVSVATSMGWIDIFDKVASNPFFLPGMLTGVSRKDQFDEPGLLHNGREFLLKWSAHSPSMFLAQFVATALNTDLAGVARRVNAQDAERNPEIKNVLGSTFELLDNWAEQLKPALAISWIRCRNKINLED